MFNFFRRPAPPEQIVLKVEIDREADGRWIVDVVDIPGVLAYGQTEEEAVAKAAALTLRVIADRLEHGECLSAQQGMRVPLDLRFQLA